MANTVMERMKKLQKMSQSVYDVFVIGGGITGAGIALDAATRGMKVALCDMQDFSAGTSSRSTKLIHGGLRYLKQLEFKVVAEVGKEREIVYNNGPHVTIPERMLLPIYENGTFGKYSTSFGLRLYDFLAQVKKSERRTMLTREEVLAKEPLLKKEGLIGGGYYVEYRTDDARLTIEVMKRAVEFGCDVSNYTKVVRFIKEASKVKGVEVVDVLSGERYEITAKKIVNATGVWVDQLIELDQLENENRLKMTKGTHIVVDQSTFPLKQAIYFDTEDGRMMFAIPRDGKTYIGTTDTFYEEDPLHLQATKEEHEYILAAIRYMFPNVQISNDNIESCWSGVRPLIYEKGKSPSEISRKDEIWIGDSGLITIAGGKLTGYRKMAETVVDIVSKKLVKEEKKLFDRCQTESLKLSGGEVNINKSHKYVNQYTKEALSLGLTKAEAEYLITQYGSNIPKVLSLLAEGVHEIEKFQLSPEVYAQLAYGIQAEFVLTPCDFFIRRTGALLFRKDWVYQWKEPVIEYMNQYFNWNEQDKRKHTEELLQELAHASQIK